jgi:hypothetical protein
MTEAVWLFAGMTAVGSLFLVYDLIASHIDRKRQQRRS